MESPKTPKKYIHAGHRARMRRRFLQEGLNSFADHEVLELLLFYAVPRQDVNAMAHALLDKFGSLPQVLEAPAEELCTIRGVGSKVAQFLNLIPDVLLQTEYCLLSPTRPPLRDPEDFAATVLRRSDHLAPGDVFLLILDAQYSAAAVYPYASFDEMDVREVALRALNLNSHRIVLTQCVDDPYALPEQSLITALSTLQQSLSVLDIQFMDFYRFDLQGKNPRSAVACGLLLPR